MVKGGGESVSGNVSKGVEGDSRKEGDPDSEDFLNHVPGKKIPWG